MNRWLVVVFALLLLLGSGVWLATVPRAARSPDEGLDAPPREAAPDARELAPPDAQWVEGRVVFPPDTPSDEEAFVLAREAGLFAKHVFRTPVAADGRFRVAFDAEVEDGLLQLEAHYLYLEWNGEWERDQEEELVLEPELGARVVGRVRVPVGFGPSPVSGVIRALEEEGYGRPPETPLGADFSFAFGGLVPGRARLDFEGEWMVGSSESFVLAAGRAQEVEFELHPGVVLGGIVRDEAGAPLEGVKVSARTQAIPDIDLPDGVLRMSAADGSFRLPALDPGRVTITGRREGYPSVSHELGKLANGARRLELELVFDSENGQY